MENPVDSGLEMRADDYIKLHAPRRRRSALEPFRADLMMMQAKGYTLGQLADFLAANGVEVSHAAISKWLRKGSIISTPRAAESNVEVPSAPRTVRPSPRPPVAAQVPPPDDEPEPDSSGTHDPAVLNNIMRDAPDLEALAKAGRKLRSNK